jgi:predicted nucleic acid-binding protein
VIVVDASVLADALTDPGPRGIAARRRLGDTELCAPALIDAEVISVLRRLVNHGALPALQGDLAVDQLHRLRLRRVVLDALIPRMWELRENLTAYDAAYVALAEALDAILVTADKRIAAAPGPRCVVELLD